MKKSAAYIAATALIVALAGCGATAKMISVKSQSERTDVFTEAVGAEAIPSGYADLTIRANIKTHLEGYFMGESRESAHGKPAYPFLVNIDGQAVLWWVKGKIHQLPEYVNGRASRDPEAGEGMKYALEKKVRLAAGMHKVFLGLPEESYYINVDLSVQSGGSYVLEFIPDYRYKTLPTRIPTFVKGIYSYKAIFSEMAIR